MSGGGEIMCEIVRGGFVFSETAVRDSYRMDCKTLWCIPVRIAENTALVRIQDTRGNHTTKVCVVCMLSKYSHGVTTQSMYV